MQCTLFIIIECECLHRNIESLPRFMNFLRNQFIVKQKVINLIQDSVQPLEHLEGISFETIPHFLNEQSYFVLRILPLVISCEFFYNLHYIFYFYIMHLKHLTFSFQQSNRQISSYEFFIVKNFITRLEFFINCQRPSHGR